MVHNPKPIRLRITLTDEDGYHVLINVIDPGEYPHPGIFVYPDNVALTDEVHEHLQNIGCRLCPIDTLSFGVGQMSEVVSELQRIGVNIARQYADWLEQRHDVKVGSGMVFELGIYPSGRKEA